MAVKTKRKTRVVTATLTTSATDRPATAPSPSRLAKIAARTRRDPVWRKSE